MPDQYAVIGNPVAHSKSPQIHAEFARQTGQDLVYERLLAPADAFVATADAFRAGGGRGLFFGALATADDVKIVPGPLVIGRAVRQRHA